MYSPEENWTDLPLHTVLYSWFAKNVSLSDDARILIGYIGLSLLIWFIATWIVRFVMSIIWPLLAITGAIVLFSFLNSYEANDIIEFLIKSFTKLADTCVTILSKVLEFILSWFQ